MKRYITALTVLILLFGIAGCKQEEPISEPEPTTCDVQLEEQGFQFYRYSIITPEWIDLITYRRQDVSISGYIQDYTLQAVAFFDYTYADEPYYIYGSLPSDNPALQARWQAFLEESGLQEDAVITLLQQRAEASYSPAQISNLLMEEQARLEINDNTLTIDWNGAIIEARYENGTLIQATYREHADASAFSIYPTPTSTSSTDAYSDFLYSLGIIHREWIDYLIDAASLMEAE